MLRALEVTDFALIEGLRIEPGPGLNVFSGETGAGKSLVVDAIQLVLGGRARADLVRRGARSARVQAVFDRPRGEGAVAALAAAGLPPEGESITLGREVGADGRSTCRLDGRVVTAAVIRRLAGVLAEVHGQGEHQSLCDPETHRDLLDLLAGEPVLALRAEVSDLHQSLRALERRRSELGDDPRDRARRRDLLVFQRDEIDAVAPRPGEEEELSTRRTVLQNAERLHTGAAAAVDGLREGEGAAADRLAAVAADLEGLARLDARLAPLARQVREAGYQVEEAARELRRYRDGLSVERGELERVEDRLASLSGLRRKYGEGVDEILAFRARLDAELADMEESEALGGRLAEEMDAVRSRLAEACGRLSGLRAAAAPRLGDRMAEELEALGMPGGCLVVAIEQEASPGGLDVGGQELAFGPRGVDRVEFLFSANAGEEPRPLQRVASGGELARVMLGLRAVLAAADPLPTLVFDEVDSGLGGRAAQAVADRLQRLAREHQVLCVTHLAIIAAAADSHLVIEKAAGGTDTGAAVHIEARHLEAGERRGEIARMLAGSAGEASLRHADEILARSARSRQRAG